MADLAKSRLFVVILYLGLQNAEIGGADRKGVEVWKFWLCVPILGNSHPLNDPYLLKLHLIIFRKKANKHGLFGGFGLTGGGGTSMQKGKGGAQGGYCVNIAS